MLHVKCMNKQVNKEITYKTVKINLKVNYIYMQLKIRPNLTQNSQIQLLHVKQVKLKGTVARIKI